LEFSVGFSKCFIVDANSTNKNKPWVWYAPTLPRHPDPSHTWYINNLIEEGISIAGCDQGEVRGSPASISRFSDFYNEMLSRGYSTKPVLLGQSRGGLMMLSWAVKNPKKLKSFIGIYPVLNLRSWPIKRSLSTTLADFGMDQDAFLESVDRHNPIHQLEGLAKAKVPLFILHGDSDQVVPLEENTQVVVEKYLKLGGEAKVKVVRGKGHQVIDAFFKSKDLIQFIIQQSAD
jgi:pimeloyl-ACP methyl ester carboxylesterase